MSDVKLAGKLIFGIFRTIWELLPLEKHVETSEFMLVRDENNSMLG